MAEPASADVISSAQGLAGELVSWRRHLHAHPELAFEEHETACFIAEQLAQIGGYEVRQGVAGTGVVADLRGGAADAPLVALRADMDALPMEEGGTGLFRSNHPGRMHACGHDANMAMLLGAAALLPSLLEPDSGSTGVRLVFQPSEETVGDDGRSGAQRMVDEGVLERVTAAFALHLDPTIALGEARLSSGYVMANVETFRAALRGAGGHGARPDATVDPIWMLAPVLSALQSVVSRRVSPLEPAVLSVCRLSAGSAANTIPPQVELEGTMRSFTPDSRVLLRAELQRALGVTRALGGDYELDVRLENPAVCNAQAPCDVIRGCLETLWPEVVVLEGPYGMLGEDFSFFADRVPAAIAMLGCAPAAGPTELHSPEFDIDERVLPVGAALLAETARTSIQLGKDKEG